MSRADLPNKTQFCLKFAKQFCTLKTEQYESKSNNIEEMLKCYSDFNKIKISIKVFDVYIVGIQSKDCTTNS